MPATRDPWLDNAKGALIVLVVIGHLWAVVPSQGLRGDVYDFLYLWHMPAFIFVAGYLSRGFGYEPRRLWDLVTTLAVPYVVAEGSLALFRIHVGGEELERVFADPHFPLWFLPALIAWRLLTPLLRPLPGAVVVAVAVSLAAGLIGHDTARYLDLARILGFLPFFVLGLKATPERLAWLRGRVPALLGALAMAAIGLLALRYDGWIESGFLYFRTYDVTGEGDGRSIGLRLAVLAIGAVGTMAFLALVPAVDGWFTRVGAATMVVYLVHGFFVKGLEYAGFGDLFAPASPWGIVVPVVVGLVIALGLASRASRRILDPVIDPFAVAQRRVDEAVAVAALSVEERGTEAVGVGAGR